MHRVPKKRYTKCCYCWQLRIFSSATSLACHPRYAQACVWKNSALNPYLFKPSSLPKYKENGPISSVPHFHTFCFNDRDVIGVLIAFPYFHQGH